MRADRQFASGSLRRPRRGLSPRVRAAALATILALLVLLPCASATAQPRTPETLLRTAFKNARQEGSYRVALDVQQTVSPEQDGPVGMASSSSESVRSRTSIFCFFACCTSSRSK